MQREINLLRIEIEQLRGNEDEARKIKEFLLAYVERVEHLRADRDEWQQEAERLSALITQVPRWLIFWARYWLDVWETWQELTAPRRPHSDRFWPKATSPDFAQGSSL
jgi:FtsZ-binding cell division protein ZapB